jgi:hypothetical protein
VVKIAVLAGLGLAGAFVANVPAGTTAAMLLACAAGFGAVRCHTAAESLALGGAQSARSMLRVARFCDDLAVALCLLALLYAVHPLS